MKTKHSSGQRTGEVVWQMTDDDYYNRMTEAERETVRAWLCDNDVDPCKILPAIELRAVTPKLLLLHVTEYAYDHSGAIVVDADNGGILQFPVAVRVHDVPARILVG